MYDAVVAEAAHRARGGDGRVRRVTLVAPDYSTLLPIARLPLSERGAAVAQLRE
jgi:hypothetical protein